MDAVDTIFRVLKEHHLENLKACFVTSLIRQKVFHKFKIFGKYFTIAVDASGVTSYSKRHCEHCLTKKYENTTVYFHYVLEAKLVTSNGFCISLATEWIENNENDFNKQDCEHKAFKRLAKKLKHYFPRLPICILADGLYPNEPFFRICTQNQWSFIVTLKDGNLKSVQEEISLLPESKKIKKTITRHAKYSRTQQNYKWVNDIDYKNISLSWIECSETITSLKSKEDDISRFVFITNIKITNKEAAAIVYAGRQRWKIENEGFNIQKNNGYEMQHQYSRISYLAMKNYYQCMQIAHLINQLAILSKNIKELFKQDTTLTVKHIWKRLISLMLEGQIDVSLLYDSDIGKIQIRFA